MSNAWVKRVKISLVVLLVMVAVVVTCFRWLTPWVNQHKAEFEHQLSLLLGETVTIKTMQTSWYWFQPVLKLEEVLVYSNGQSVLQLNKLLVGVDVSRSLWHWQIQPGVLVIDDIHATVRQGHDGWHVDGVRRGHQLPNVAPSSYWPIARWVLAQQKIIVKNMSARVQLADGTIIPLHNFNFKAVHRDGHFRAKGQAFWGTSPVTELNLLSDVSFASNSLTALNGQVYLALEHAQLSPWHTLFSGLPLSLKQGEGQVKLWLDFVNGKVSLVQANVDLSQVDFTQKSTNIEYKIKKLSANMALHPTESGWELNADHVHLITPDTTWPLNSLSIKYTWLNDEWRIFVKKIILSDPLMRLMNGVDMVASAQNMRLAGVLKNTQLLFHHGQLDYALSRFTGLSWNAQGVLPEVANASGAIAWEPTSGRMEMDGENTRLAWPNRPSLALKNLNLAADWVVVDGAYRVRVERFVLEHPHLILSGRGTLSDITAQSLGTADLNAEFSADHAEFWLPYLPRELFKPKLRDWLHHVQQVEHVSGHGVLQGAWHDFPFDATPGEFNLTTSWQGVDLRFHPAWPMVHGIDALLNVDKRALSVNITRADLNQGLMTERFQLDLTEIGLGHETLLIKGYLQAPAEKMLAYIQVSPLRKKLAKLAMLSVQNSLGLDLALVIPLYTDTPDLFVRGGVHWDDNALLVRYAAMGINLQGLTGTVFFDEHGLLPSVLHANLLDDSLTLHLSSCNEPIQATVIDLEGDFDLSLWRKQWPMPWLDVIHGRLPLEGRVLLADDAKDADRIALKSSLRGVTVALPEPLGKANALDDVGLAVNLALRAKHTSQLSLRYGEHLRADLGLVESKQGLAAHRGQICLDCAQEMKKDNDRVSGVAVNLTFAQLDWSAWQPVLSKFMHVSSAMAPSWNFRVVNLLMHTFLIGGQTYSDMAINAHQASPNAWDIAINHQKIAAQLHYLTHENQLSGQVSRLVLKKNKKPMRTDATAKSLPTMVGVKPSQWPGLDLTFDSITWDDTPIGQALIKANHLPHAWQVDTLTLKGLSYLLQLSGQWQRDDAVNKTSLQAQLNVSHVAKFLANWNIPEVVEAHAGELSVKAQWPGDPLCVALDQMKGELALVVKNGRITHLDPETEKKIVWGKLLSILSLQTIPRRLKLDFSDLAQTGYTFDRFQGDFTLKAGVLTTENSTINGPVASATMKGVVDIMQRLYDLDVRVTPHITASIPVIVSVAGSPIAGVATWVATKMINSGVDKVTSYTYKITGPWLEPVVQQVKIYHQP